MASLAEKARLGNLCLPRDEDDGQHCGQQVPVQNVCVVHNENDTGKDQAAASSMSYLLFAYGDHSLNMIFKTFQSSWRAGSVAGP